MKGVKICREEMPTKFKKDKIIAITY